MNTISTVYRFAAAALLAAVLLAVVISLIFPGYVRRILAGVLLKWFSILDLQQAGSSSSSSTGTGEGWV